MEICHAFQKSNLNTFVVFKDFVDVKVSNERQHFTVAGDSS